MSSPPPPFRDSSPAGGPGRPRSHFTYRHLSQLASYSTACPLRVIAHIDLDAFYAQCEMVRLGVPEDQPLAVQQWQGLIAINYPAREFDIGRMCTVDDAKKLCPHLIAQHVATWKEGDEKWAYHEDAAANIATHKVSLDPYRQQSRKILALVRQCLPANLQKVEKASIDEVFIDLSAQVHSILLDRYPELARPPPYDDPTEKLPAPSTTALNWKADALVDLDDVEAEADDPDWDDVAILIGSEIVRGIRREIRDKLKYTCSAGIASNKMLSKLGSGHRKPNQQTVIRNRAIQTFLANFKFTKIRNLGGKLGDQVVQNFHTESVQGLLPVPVEQLKLRLGDDTGIWLYNTIRGIDSSDVNSRTQIKSMLSAKSFRPNINSYEHGVKWLRIFVADIFSRLVEEGVLENKRRPKTINLQHRHGGQTRSRQSPIPQGKQLDEQTLFGIAKSLLGHIVLEGRVWPCANLSLSVGGFEEGVTGNLGIGAFLLKGEEAQALKSGRHKRALEAPEAPDQQPTGKRGRKDEGDIQKFFTRKDSSDDLGVESSSSEPFRPPEVSAGHGGGEISYHEPIEQPSDMEKILHGPGRLARDAQSETRDDHGPGHPLACPRCHVRLSTEEKMHSHRDWHFAKDLQEEERVRSTFVNGPSTSAANARNGQKHSSAASRRGGKSKIEQGQSRLKFG